MEENEVVYTENTESPPPTPPIEQVDIDALQESIDALRETIEQVNTTEEVATDENGNPVESTEVATEDPVVVALNEGFSNLDNRMVTLQNTLEESMTTEEVTEQATEATEEPVLTFEDETVDNALYMSSKVENATMDDMYSLVLSFRNVTIVLMFMLIGFLVFRMLRNAVERVMYR